MRLLNFIFLFSTLSSCVSKTLIKDTEYAKTHALYKQSEFQMAAEAFPKKEEHGFITSVEKSWISLWKQKGDNSELEKQIKSLDQRQYISVSQEAEFFFFNESADGYIPSEHEVVSLHLINSMIYMQQKKWDDAEVEARRASYFLQKIFNPDQAHFDDPALRLWLASVWMGLNNWEAAQVDLRRINEMSYNSDIQKLLILKKPPAFFRLYLKGSGPELIWSNSSVTPEFTIRGDSLSKFTASSWYQRHLVRNTVIRDTVLKSNYMTQYLGIKTNSGAQKAIGYSFGNASRILGLTLGAAIAVGGTYIIASAGSSSGNTGESIGAIVGLGLVVGKYFWQAGDDIIWNSNADAKSYEEREFENLRTYRFIRFLPNKFDFEVTKNSTQDQVNRLILFRPESATEVEFVLNP